MKLRRLQTSDAKDYAAPLSDLGAATFTQTFGHLYSPEDLQHFLDTAHAPQSYADALASDNHPIWIIEDDDVLIAYIKLCPNGLPCDPPLPDAIEISKLYAMAGYRNMGLGAQLMDAAMRHARDNGYKDMVLSVFSGNPGGQKFYARHGFEKIGDYLFPVGKQLDNEWIMHKRL